MVQSVGSGSGNERGTFWKAYRACVEENGVRPDRSPFYVKWAQTFARFLPQKRLQDRSGKDIQAFLAHLSQRQGIADWQVGQAEHALKVLYEIFLPRYAPEKPPAPKPIAGKEDQPRQTTAKRARFADRA